jgi:hypothetical protein
MRRAYCLAALMAAVVVGGHAAAQGQKPPPAGKAKMRVLVELTGLLKVTEKGASLTFTNSDVDPWDLISSRTVVWQVDLSRSAKLRKKAAELNGKEVIVEGTAEVWIKEFQRPATPSMPIYPPSYQPPPPPPPYQPPPTGPYVVTPPPPTEKSYRLETQHVVKATALRAKE